MVRTMDRRLARLAALAESSIAFASRQLAGAGVRGLLPVMARLRRLGSVIALLAALGVQEEGGRDGRNH